ncbi:MAG TPA: haloacid dehalogenase-like hydrolase [archaeon]|nr:haloacid dehalogenase-like hydrolase [archaeon]
MYDRQTPLEVVLVDFDNCLFDECWPEYVGRKISCNRTYSPGTRAKFALMGIASRVGTFFSKEVHPNKLAYKGFDWVTRNRTLDELAIENPTDHYNVLLMDHLKREVDEGHQVVVMTYTPRQVVERFLKDIGDELKEVGVYAPEFKINEYGKVKGLEVNGFHKDKFHLLDDLKRELESEFHRPVHIYASYGDRRKDHIAGNNYLVSSENIISVPSC